jgi:hypothetical protein
LPAFSERDKSGLSLCRGVCLAQALLSAKQQQLLIDCCEPESEKLSQQQVKARVKKTEPIFAPCCADMLHIRGTVVLATTADAEGNVTCVQMVSGPPLVIGVTIDSVRRWKFRPYALRRLKKTVCGHVVLQYRATQYGVKYKVV